MQRFSKSGRRLKRLDQVSTRRKIGYMPYSQKLVKCPIVCDDRRVKWLTFPATPVLLSGCLAMRPACHSVALFARAIRRKGIALSSRDTAYFKLNDLRGFMYHGEKAMADP